MFDKVFRAPKADDQDVTWEHGSEANSRFYTTNTPETNFKVGFKEGKHEFFPYPQTVLDTGLFLKPPFSAAVESPITKIVVVFVLDVISNASMNTHKIAFIFFICL